jgi:LysM repeat protein
MMSRLHTISLIGVATALAGTLAPLAPADAQTLRGSPASVDLMYTSAHSHDLAFLQNRDDIYGATKDGELQMLSITEDLDLERVAYPFVLPATKRFADSLAKAYHEGCGQRLIVTSGARPIDEQPPNASPKSVHPTGMAVDFHKPAEPCLSWLRKNLLALEDAHVIEATEEHHPAHFHVAVLHQAPERRAVLASATTSGRTSVANGDVAPMRAASNPTTTSAPASTAPATASTSSNASASTSSADSKSSSDDSKTYRVRAGDNLWTIAERHNTTVERLQELNGLHGSRLRVGQQLRLR